jgi:hypothetical protein
MTAHHLDPAVHNVSHEQPASVERPEDTDLLGDRLSTLSRSFGAQQGTTSSSSDVWLTLAALGPFDLDPCAAPDPRPWPTATRHYTAADDGLRQPWAGRVWLNPPYSTAGVWLQRLVQHRIGTALIFARTDTAAVQEHVLLQSTAVLFIRGRVRFHHPDGRRAADNGGAPSVLIAYGQHDAARLQASTIPGVYLPIPALTATAAARTGPAAEAHLF